MSLFKTLVRIFNGKTTVIGKENLPSDEKYLLIAPHRTFLDPVFIAINAYPDTFAFMGKKELFEVPLFGRLIRRINAFPVDRENPGVSVIRTPVNYLKNNELNVLMFPTGSRHSSEIKGGAITIAKLSKCKVIPAVYSGPLTLKDLLLRKKAVVKFGKPFEVKRKIDGIDDINRYYSDKIQDSFDQLDESI